MEAKEVIGSVLKIMSRNPHTVFTMRDEKGEELMYQLPDIFCPIDVGDSVYGFVNNSNQFIAKPFVQLPVSEADIKACFHKAIKKFHPTSSERLYSALQSLAERLGYIGKTKPLVRKQESIETKIRYLEAFKIDYSRTEPLSSASLDSDDLDYSIEDCFAELIKNFKREYRMRLLLYHPDKGGNADDFRRLQEIYQEWLKSEKDAFFSVLPSTPSTIVINYLSDISYKYSKLKDETIVETISVAAQVDQATIKTLLIWWHAHRNMRRLYLLGLTKKEIREINLSCEEIYNIVMDNPYRLAPIPMDKCADILRSMNSTPTEEQIICGKILRFVYKKQKTDGNTCTPYKNVSRFESQFRDYIEVLVAQYGIVTEDEFCYTKYAYDVEAYMVNYLDKLIKQTMKMKAASASSSDIYIDTYTWFCTTLSQEQKLAIESCLENKISMINAEPGTGKTMCVTEMIKNLEKRDISYAVVSFTGKAVSRINEMLGKKGVAMTMDSMIMKATKIDKFKHLIIDEVSMVTTELLYRFIIAFPHNYKITFIGDFNQLQPIGWGLLMQGLIQSCRCPTSTLTENYRIMNNDGGTILRNSQAIFKSGETIEGDDFIMLDGDYIAETVNILKTLHKMKVAPKRIGILLPFSSHLAQFNRLAQDIFTRNSKNKSIDFDNKTYCIGDKVMMVQNNYDIEIMNGVTGYIVDIVMPGDLKHVMKLVNSDNKKEFESMLTNGAVLVKFDYDETLYPFLLKANPLPAYKKGQTDVGDDDLELDPELTVSWITHAFAITIDKSQGSEYEFCIVVFPPCKHSSFLHKKRSNTAITRTRSICWVIGKEAYLLSIMTEPSYRYDRLGYKLSLLRDPELEGEINQNLTILQIQNDDNDYFNMDDLLFDD